MQRGTLSIIRTIANGRQLALIIGLAALGALTEGIGFVLLVPLLAIMLGSGESSGVFSPVLSWIENSAWMPGLGALLAGFAALIALRSLADYARVMVSLRQSMTIVDGLRARVFSALLAADWRTLSRMRQSDNRAMLISDIDRTAIALEQLGALVRIAIGLIAIGIAAFAIAPAIALAGLVAGSLVLWLHNGRRKRARVLGEQLGQRYRQVHGSLDESLSALRVIKSFGAEGASRDKVIGGFQSLREVRLRFTSDTLKAQAILQVSAAIAAAILLWLALSRWDVSAIVLLPLVALFARALPQLGALVNSWQMWAHSAPALVAADALIREAEQAAEAVPDAVAGPPRLARDIRLNEVSFSHREGHATLEKVSLTLKAGETVALVGPSGAGKSTLADILGGLLAPDEGSMAIDGVTLDPAMRHGWRQQVAYVDQTPVLFHGTIRSNLLWVRPESTETRLNEVLAMAAADFVHALPNGIDCPIGEGGRQLSGGERQRIVLARALLRDPALLILDEATSALDARSDAAVAEAISAMAGQRTVLIIGHRGALTDNARRLITLIDGRIAADETKA